MKDKQEFPPKIDTNGSDVNNRRSFFKKAAIGGSFIATITSRPVWAGQCSLSGNLSNNVSNQGAGQTCYLKGYSPSSWLTLNFNSITLTDETKVTLSNNDLSAQQAAYNLNIILWDELVTECQNSIICSSPAHQDFYFDTSTASPISIDSLTELQGVNTL